MDFLGCFLWYSLNTMKKEKQISQEWQKILDIKKPKTAGKFWDLPIKDIVNNFSLAKISKKSLTEVSWFVGDNIFSLERAIRLFSEWKNVYDQNLLKLSQGHLRVYKTLQRRIRKLYDERYSKPTDKRWKEILNIKKNKKDKKGWGLMILSRLRQSFDFSKFSKQGMVLVTKFLKEERDLLKKQIDHYRKWSPRVYHKNVYLSREFELEKIEELLNRIKNVK